MVTANSVQTLDPANPSVLREIGRLRYIAWSNEITVGSTPRDEWIDEFDAKARNFGIYLDGRLIASARFSTHMSIEDVPDAEVYKDVFHSALQAPIASINRLVTHPDYRGRGCSKLLDEVRIQSAHEEGCKSMIGHASANRIKQLEELGFLNMGRGRDYDRDHFLSNAGENYVLFRTLTSPMIFKPNTDRESIISLLRGAFAVPVICSISDLGITERILSVPFTVQELGSPDKSKSIAATINYLLSLGLIDSSEDGTLFKVTETGRYVFERSGVFGLLNSYRNYFTDFKANVQATKQPPERVDRFENILSSGQMHSRKYFPWAIDRIKNSTTKNLVDLGCGNGEYLSKAISASNAQYVVAVDLSSIAVAHSTKRLSSTFDSCVIEGIVCSADDIESWSKLIPCNGESTIISAWFVLHEFCHGGSKSVIEWLERLHSACPEAELIVAEIVATPPSWLASVHRRSIYPEIHLFHELSGQSLLPWHEHENWIQNGPYELVATDLHDSIEMNGQSVPSTVIWHLAPK